MEGKWKGTKGRERKDELGENEPNEVPRQLTSSELDDFAEHSSLTSTMSQKEKKKGRRETKKSARSEATKSELDALVHFRSTHPSSTNLLLATPLPCTALNFHTSSSSNVFLHPTCNNGSMNAKVAQLQSEHSSSGFLPPTPMG